MTELKTDLDEYLERDTDGDNLPDYDENVAGFDRYTPDTDADGINDFKQFMASNNDAVAEIPNEEIVYGDINNDGFVNVIDLTLLKFILLYESESNQDNKIADVNGDGIFDNNDYDQVNQFIHGNISTFNATNINNIKSVSNQIQPLDSKYENDSVIFNFGGEDIEVSAGELYNTPVTIYYEVSEQTKITYEEYEALGDVLGEDIDITGDTESIFNLPKIATINSLGYGGQFNTFINPVLKIGEDIYKGNAIDLANLENQIFNFTINSQGHTDNHKIVMSKGGMFSLVFNFGSMSQGEFAASYIDYMESTAKINKEQNLTTELSLNSIDESNVYSAEYLGKLLRFIGTSYFIQLDTFKKGIAEEYNIEEDNPIRVARFGYTPQILDEGIQKQGEFYCDVFGDYTYPVSLDNDDVSLDNDDVSLDNDDVSLDNNDVKLASYKLTMVMLLIYLFKMLP
jgi:hypothetical protein